MKRLMIPGLLAFGFLAQAAFASAPAPAEPAEHATVSDTVVDEAVADAPRKAGEDRCVRETGSRIPREDGECNGQPGTSYSREDLDRTGAGSIGEALQRLDTRL